MKIYCFNPVQGIILLFFSEKVIFYTKAEKLMLRQLSIQVFPKNPNLLNECLEWVKKKLPEGKVNTTCSA